MDQDTIRNITQTLVELISTYGLNVLGALAILVFGEIPAAVAERGRELDCSCDPGHLRNSSFS